MGTASDKDYNIICLISASISLTFIIVLSIYHFIKRFTNKSATQDHIHPSSTSLISWYNAQILFSFLIILFYGLHVASMLFRDLHYVILFSCEFGVRLVGAMWCLSKASLWTLLILRLQVSFADSELVYSTKKVIIPMLSYICFYVLVISTLGFFYTQGSNTNDHSSDGSDSEFNTSKSDIRCVWEYPIWALILTLVSDMIVSVVCLCLFVRPLLVMMNEAKEVIGDPNDSRADENSYINNNSDARMWFLIKKYVILVSIAVVTTFIALITLFLDANNALNAIICNICFDLDAIINVACVILMNAIHGRLYIKLCWICDTCINVDKITAPLQSRISTSAKIVKMNSDHA